jgi:hypothetical protein
MSAVPIYCRLGAAPPAVTAPLRHAGNEGGRARLVGTAGAGGTSPILRRGSRLGGAPARTRRRHGDGDRSSRSVSCICAGCMRTRWAVEIAVWQCTEPTRPTKEVRLHYCTTALMVLAELATAAVHVDLWAPHRCGAHQRCAESRRTLRRCSTPALTGGAAVRSAPFAQRTPGPHRGGAAPWRWPGPEYGSAGHFLRHFQQPASECESDARLSD